MQKSREGYGKKSSIRSLTKGKKVFAAKFCNVKELTPPKLSAIRKKEATNMKNVWRDWEARSHHTLVDARNLVSYYKNIAWKENARSSFAVNAVGGANQQILGAARFFCTDASGSTFQARYKDLVFILLKRARCSKGDANIVNSCTLLFPPGASSHASIAAINWEIGYICR